MIFDLHCDTVWKIYKQRKMGKQLSLLSSVDLQLDEEKMRKGGYFAQCFALWVHARHEDPYRVYRELLEIYREELAKCAHLLPVYRYSDFFENHRKGKMSAVLTMEDSAPLGTSLERLREFYNDGVRMISLTWNYPNSVGYPNLWESLEADTVNGLTEFGREVVREMNRLGIVIDVSHLSDAGFYDVLTLTEKPIVASHSNARALCPHPRNLSDDMLYRLAEKDGVLGMNYAAAFLDVKNGQKTVPFLLSHIKYIKKKIGISYIALGSDFDGINPNIQLQNAGMMQTLIDDLQKEGFTDGEIDKLTHENALRVFAACLRP